MSGRQAAVAWGLVFSACVLLCIAISAAQNPSGRTTEPGGGRTEGPAAETLLPAGAVAYVGWDGSDAHQEAWQSTAAYQSLYETGLADVVRKLLVFLVQQSGADTGDVMPLMDQISRKGVSLAVSIPEAGPPLPQAVVVIHDGQQLHSIVDGFLKRAIAGDLNVERRNLGSRTVSSVLVPNSPGIEFAWWIEGAHLVLAGGIDVVNQTVEVAEGRSANVTTSPLWSPSHEVHPDRVASLVSWLDFAELREAYGAMPVPNPNRDAPPLTVAGILNATGLGSLGPLVYRSGYAGPAMWSEMTLAAPEPRTGLLTPWGYDSIALEELPPMPSGVTGFYARTLDWSKMHDETLSLLRSIAQLGPPEASSHLERAIAEVNSALKIDLRQDLFDPLGDVFCVYADQLQGFMGFGAVAAIKVDDAVRLRTTLTNLLLRLSAESRGQVMIRAVPKNGRELTVLQFADVPFAPAVCVDEDWLVVGLTTQAVESFLLRKDGKIPRWEPTPEHADGLKQIDDDFTSISITDPRETVKSLLGTAPMLMTFVGFGMSQQARMGRPGPTLPFNVDDVPPTELVTAPLFPNVSVCTADDAGIRWRSRTSIPSIPLTTSFGGGSGVAVTGTLVALLLPAVQQARVAARRTQSRNNLHSIGIAMHNYHDVHNMFPPGTHPNDVLDVEKRFSWMAEILPFVDQSALFDRLDMDRAWNDDKNKAMTNSQIMTYMNPNEPPGPNPGVTQYVGLAGVGEDAPTLPAGHKRAGVFGYDRVTRIRDIRDGTSNTVAVSEASGADARWAAGGKQTIRALTKKPYINGPDGLGGSFPGGSFMLFCDGSVKFISESIDPALMESLSTVAGEERIPDF